MLRARGPRAVHSGDEFESQIKEAFRKALEDHAKGDESDQQILGTSPLGPYLKKKEVAADTDEDDDDDEPAPARARRSDYSVAAAPAAAADAADAADAAAPADVPIDVDITIAGAKRSRSGARVQRPARVCAQQLLLMRLLLMRLLQPVRRTPRRGAHQKTPRPSWRMHWL